MPLIAIIDGIRIEVYFDDHPPPHFHARSAEHRFQMRISDQAVIAGSAPVPVIRKVRAWAFRHRRELLDAWKKVSNWEVPKRID